MEIVHIPKSILLAFSVMYFLNLGFDPETWDTLSCRFSVVSFTLESFLH